jgi:hypothetical protein
MDAKQARKTRKAAVAAIQWIQSHDMTAHVKHDVEPPEEIRDLVNTYVLKAVTLCMEQAADYATELIGEDHLIREY